MFLRNSNRRILVWIFQNRSDIMEPEISSLLCHKRWKSSSASTIKRPKKRVYFREHDLDHVMDLQKRPSLVLQLKRLLFKQRNRSILIRDLEKEVGLVQKWNFMSIIERYPRIFRVTGGNLKPLLLEFTEEANAILKEEDKVRKEMEPLVVNNLRKLLMMAKDKKIALHKIDQIKHEMGLPEDFQESLIPKHPNFFRLETGSDLEPYLVLGEWDPGLAVSAREVYATGNTQILTRRTLIPRDGNFLGPYAFKIKFPASFKPRRRQLEDMAKWQNLPFASPYSSPSQLDPRNAATQKRNVAVLHEILSLTLEKRLTAVKLDMFHFEFRLPTRLLATIVRHNGVFYMTNKGDYSTVFLKEAYEGHELIYKCPLLEFYERFFELMGKRNFHVRSANPRIELKRVWSP